MSTLFTAVEDPQRHKRMPCVVQNSKWYTSVRSLGMSALLLHDCLPDEEVASLQTHQIRFLRVDPPRGFSTNDYRFMLFYGILSGQKMHESMFDTLRVNAQWQPPVANVFLTDMFDVEFGGNPFELIFGSKYHLYAAVEEVRHGPRAPRMWNTWMTNKADTCKFVATGSARDLNVTSVILNAGAFGGPVMSMLPLLRSMTLRMLASPPDLQSSNCNMMTYNMGVHNTFAVESLYWGYPMHSAFHRHENKSSGAYIMHK